MSIDQLFTVRLERKHYDARNLKIDRKLSKSFGFTFSFETRENKGFVKPIKRKIYKYQRIYK